MTEKEKKPSSSRLSLITSPKPTGQASASQERHSCTIPPLSAEKINKMTEMDIPSHFQLLLILHEWVHDRLAPIMPHVTRWAEKISMVPSRTTKTSRTSSLNKPQKSEHESKFQIDESHITCFFMKLIGLTHYYNDMKTFMEQMTRQQELMRLLQDDEIINTLSWPIQVLLYIFLGYYKWLRREHDESQLMFVKAMSRLSPHEEKDVEETLIAGEHDVQTMMPSESWQHVLHEVAEFLTAQIHTLLGSLARYVESIPDEDAIAHLQHALSIFQRFQHHTMILKTLLELSLLHVESNNLEAAKEHLVMGTSLLQSFKDTESESPYFARLRMRHRMNEAWIAYLQDEHEKALNIMIEVARDLREHPLLNQDLQLRWRVLHVLSFHQYHLTSATHLQKTMLEALPIALTLKNLDYVVGCYVNLIQLSIFQSRYSDAVHHEQRLETILRSWNDPTRTMKTSALEKEKLSSTVDDLHDDDSRKMASFHAFTPQVEMRLEWIKGLLSLEAIQDPRKALTHLQRALIISEDLDAPSKTCSILIFMALAHLKLGHLEEAERYSRHVSRLLPHIQKNESLNNGNHGDEDITLIDASHSEIHYEYTLLHGQYCFLNSLLSRYHDDATISRKWIQETLKTWRSLRTPSLPHRYWKAKTITALLDVFGDDMLPELSTAVIDEGIETCQTIPNHWLEATCLMHKGKNLLTHLIIKDQDISNENHDKVSLNSQLSTSVLASPRTETQDQLSRITVLRNARDFLARAKKMMKTHRQTVLKETRDPVMLDHYLRMILPREYQATELLAMACDLMNDQGTAASHWNEAWELFQELHSMELETMKFSDSARNTLWWG